MVKFKQIMAHLIDKSALVAKIDRRKNFCQGVAKANENNEFTYFYYKGKTEAYSEMQEFLDTFEVKEVDLEKALSDLDKDIKEFVTTEEFENESTTAGHYWVIAKHAFLLGLKAQKGEEV